MTLVQALKSEAHRLGFYLAGITTPDPPVHISAYERWIAAGRHGDMGYLATERARMGRADPCAVLPDCRSILIVGARYPAGAGWPVTNFEADNISATAGPGSGGNLAGSNLVGGNAAQGCISAYACGPDYHDLFPPRLQALVAFLESQVGHPIPNRWYTDTGPLLERDLAQRAGLGWIGKNTCLIAPGQGSYVLLAEILLGIDLEPDSPFLAERCGTCTRCLDACPTGCILPDRTIDARRCISYLTIELKSAIPPDLRALVGKWVFGCDVCQQVCPWNRKSDASPVGFIPDLKAELNLTPVEFNRRYQGTPLKRAKRRGYLRNVAVALGNAHDLSAVPALAQTLRHETEPLVRGHAAWALGHIGGEKAQEVLQTSLGEEADEVVRAEIRSALDKLLAN
jgi:epoxyqueuosine reductase